MLSAVHTLDYEIHGNGDGCPYALMVEPTARLLDLFDRFGAKLTIMADVAEILKFREFRDQFGRDDFHYEKIVAQLQDAVRRGHDVQLHLHCSYFNARFESGKWVQDWSEYNFAGLPPERLEFVVRTGKEFLEKAIQPVAADYRCVAFRAANWAVSPSRNVVRALVANGIKLETSVFKYGKREGIVSFDYSNAHSNLVPWPAAEEDICSRNESSKLLEVPIYCERRWIGAFVSRNRFQRAWEGRKHRIASSALGVNAIKKSSLASAQQKLRQLTAKHAWKADFNQCTGRQLIAAIQRASSSREVAHGNTPFVLIGHSKLFDRWNEKSLEPFLRWVESNPSKFRFANLSEFVS